MPCPMIGIAGSIDKEERRQSIVRDYMSAVAEAGGLPVMLSYDMTGEERREFVRRIDGLMLAGGNDLAPERYGHLPIDALGDVDPLRDEMEFWLVKAVAAEEKPIFGICRGVQTLNAAFGGTLYQDLKAQYPSKGDTPLLCHQQTRGVQYPSHRVTLAEDSLLFDILGQREIGVNSFHHQAVWQPAPGLEVSAAAQDGVTEALEKRAYPFLLGVQWHPERMYRTDPMAMRLFEAFVCAAGK